MKTKIRLLLNIGTDDANKLGLGPDERKEDTVVNVDKDVADILIKNGWGTTPELNAPVPGAGPARPVEVHRAMQEGGKGGPATGAGAAGTSADDSPLSETNADQAIDQISRMKSPEKLQAIAANDKRATVKAAAQKRLGEL